MNESSKEQNEMVNVATHQLKTALTTNKWALNYLLSDGTQKISETQREVLSVVYESNERAMKILKSIMLADKEALGSFEIRKSNVNLPTVIKRIIKEIEPEARKKKIELNFKTKQDNFPEIEADEEKIGYVLENIIGDALLYTRDNGKISVDLEVVGNDVNISISDTGIGIVAEDQSFVFNKFFRGKNAREMSVGGTGLGLFISKYIIQKHNGTINFESREGEGTTFFITLPVA